MRILFRTSESAQQAKMGTTRATPVRHALHRLQRAVGNYAVQRSLSGAPLPRELRPSLERHFKTSLDGVRVHTDAESQASADAIGARAYTVGKDIHLGSEGIRTSGDERRELLAHEVVHTLQQGAGTNAKRDVGSRDDSFERQADRLAAPFHRSDGLQVSNGTIGEGVLKGASAIQRKVSTHYGEFEDYRYQDLTDAAGTPVGVEMYLKFEPGVEARADLIGMSQALEARIRGARRTDGIRGVHQASSGVGTGYYIDRNEGYPNPLYPTRKPVKAGGNAANLTDYDTSSIDEMTAAEQAAEAAATGIRGQRYEGWGKHGYRKLVNGAWTTEPAELYDVPMIAPPPPSTEQIFETAALAIAGPQEGTYYGSVEWGWRTDAKGTFTRLPLRAVSQGVPSVNFLTAASVWNPSKVSLAYYAAKATNILDGHLKALIAVPADAELVATGREGAAAGINYLEMTYGGQTGYVVSTDIRAVAVGAETVNLPVPMVQTVSNPLGTNMSLSSIPRGLPPAIGPDTLALPFGTRVVIFSCTAPSGGSFNYYQGHVVDGDYTGTHGYFFADDLTIEALGTR